MAGRVVVDVGPVVVGTGVVLVEVAWGVVVVVGCGVVVVDVVGWDVLVVVASGVVGDVN